jgi:hypothetical protein
VKNDGIAQRSRVFAPCVCHTITYRFSCEHLACALRVNTSLTLFDDGARRLAARALRVSSKNPTLLVAAMPVRSLWRRT